MLKDQAIGIGVEHVHRNPLSRAKNARAVSPSETAGSVSSVNPGFDVGLP